MSLDREKVRALMETAVAEGDPEFEHADAIYAWEVLALLAELEQAEQRIALMREAWASEQEDFKSLIASRDYLDEKLDAAESRLAKVPALVEALKETEVELRVRAIDTNEAGQILPPYTADSVLALADELAAALATWEAE